MEITEIDFGRIVIDGKEYSEDLVIHNGRIEPRNKEISAKRRGRFGHTLLSIDENIPWDCEVLVIGNGVNEAMPVMDEVRQEAAKRGVKLVITNTRSAARQLEKLQKEKKKVNALLHLTC